MSPWAGLWGSAALEFALAVAWAYLCAAGALIGLLGNTDKSPGATSIPLHTADLAKQLKRPLIAIVPCFNLFQQSQCPLGQEADWEAEAHTSQGKLGTCCLLSTPRL